MLVDELEQRQLLGRRIRQARELLNLSQEELANRISRTQYAISEYENANRRIYAHDIPRLAQALNVSISYFFTPDDERTDTTQYQEEYLLAQFRNLPTDEAKQFATNLLRDLNTVTRATIKSSTDDE